MSNPAALEIAKDPGQGPQRNGLFAWIFALLAAFGALLLRWFSKKHPADFDEVVGAWASPEVNITPGVNRPVPRPLIINDCKRGVLVYSAVINNVKACTPAERAAALAQADGALLTYFQNNFQCRNPNCIRKEAPLVWSGTRCFNNPTAASGAVLRRFQCRVEL
jgi:hypothetical protein